MHAIYGHIAQARFRTANLDVFAFAFVAFKGNAGQPAQGIRNIRIRQAGEIASGLTRQLLAFSRRQVLQPQVLQVNVIGFALSALGWLALLAQGIRAGRGPG